MGKVWPILGGGFRVFNNSNYRFYSTTLIWFIIYMQTERLSFFCFSVMFLAYFIFIKVFEGKYIEVNTCE